MIALRTGVLAALLAALGCGTAHSPEEPPRRILELERDVVVRLVSVPAGRRVFALGTDGAAGPLLGVTPVAIGQVRVVKEMWKHGRETPPAVASRPLVSEVAGGAGAPLRTALGPGPSWSVLIETEAGALRRLDLALAPEELDRAYARGRADFLVPETTAR